MQRLSGRDCDPALGLRHSKCQQSFDHDQHIERLRPIRATLSETDFWQLQDQRRRREIGGPAEDPHLAAYLRAKLADARIIPEPEARRAFVTSGRVVACRIDHHLPRCFRLYHWTPPVQRCAISTGTWLGAVLIGMAPHQIVTFSDPEAGFRRIEILHINAEDFLPADNRHSRGFHPADTIHSHL
ncbi:hypothetical protein [Paracoccus onubensis]|uniref:Uncharacterized protein n=1 Tax=Paracoccus onubensis TaxID=1675788 RepID=A0A418T820_9RHOB|nr:hypothetical protein [Paracoccus onubensis]RJE89385.1 hypothetical protein D3P04_01770 [Paracoccus onubensis]